MCDTARLRGTATVPLIFFFFFFQWDGYISPAGSCVSGTALWLAVAVVYTPVQPATNSGVMKRCQHPDGGGGLLSWRCRQQARRGCRGRHSHALVGVLQEVGWCFNVNLVAGTCPSSQGLDDVVGYLARSCPRGCPNSKGVSSETLVVQSEGL